MIDNAHIARDTEDMPLTEVVEESQSLARKLGLDGFPVKYWVVDYEEMNELIAYDGFPTRYPHWRWGMKYNQQQKQDQYGDHRAFEIVINDNPAHAYLQESNSLTDQKTVISHVEAHVDFFKHNRWFGLFETGGSAVRMLERHAERIQKIMDDPDNDREAVERYIDSVFAIIDTINQYQPLLADERTEDPGKTEEVPPIEALGVSAEVRDAVFGEDWLEDHTERDEPEEPIRDVLAFLRSHGKQFDSETEKAIEMEDWQKTIIDIIRTEAYYFAPQKMTRVMNEGFAAYFESLMMSEEALAQQNEFIQYATHHSQVLGSPGLNPYKLGKAVWEHIENVANRREVVEHLLRVEGVTPENFLSEIDFDQVIELLEPVPPIAAITTDTVDELTNLDPAKVDSNGLDRALSGAINIDRYPWKVLSYEGLAERHFSLTKPRNRGFLRAITLDELKQINRYLFDTDRYATIAEALEDVSYSAGWDRIFEVRESHNDITFLDEFLTPRFVQDHEYFTYEYSHRDGGFRVASRDPADVKKKLLLQFANFGKPTITVHDGNYNNRNELLLAHHYNGIQLDLEKATETLKRVFDLWGRPVCLKTIAKVIDKKDLETAKRRGTEPTPDEQGRLLRYDGEEIEITDLPWEEVEEIAATDVDYGTKPEDWL